MEFDRTVWVTTEEAGKIMGVSRITILSMINAEIFDTATRMSDKPRSRYMIRIDEVIERREQYRYLRNIKCRCGRKPLYEHGEA